MESKHTPGPWDFCSTLHNGESYQRIVSPDGKRIDKYGSHQTIALVPWDTDGDVQANARLIASAPHLLQVLDTVAVALEDYYAGMSEWDDGLLATVRAALAKATA